MTIATATVTSKGQVTIPKAIRTALGIEESSRLMFVLEGESVRVVPLGRRTLTELAGSLRSERPWEGMAAARRDYRQALVKGMESGGESGLG
jgi:AbrB family looped-hinge helix DNA binding protein